jgi:hypothetical protein
MIGPNDSAWNQEVFRLFIDKFKEASKWTNLSDKYIKDMFVERMKRLKGVWVKGQLREVKDGVYETQEQWEQRVAAQRLEDLKNKRHLRRRELVSEP